MPKVTKDLRRSYLIGRGSVQFFCSVMFCWLGREAKKAGRVEDGASGSVRRNTSFYTTVIWVSGYDVLYVDKIGASGA